MNTENIKAFIKYQLDDEDPTNKKSRWVLGGLLLVFFGCLAAVSDMRNTFSIIGAGILILLTVVFCVLISKAAKANTVANRVACSAISSLYLTLICSLSGAIWLSVSANPSLVPVSIAPLALGLISLLASYVRVRKNGYLSQAKESAVINAAGFVAIGIFVGRKFYDAFSSQIFDAMPAEVFVAVCLLLIAAIFSFLGAPSFLKLHYVNVLRRSGTNLD